MAGGDYGNVHGNKAKTMSGRKHRNQELTVVRFVPFVGDEDGRKGVVTGESSQQVGAARAATVAGDGAVCARATEEERHLNRWSARWERRFVNA
jgi:hypothetical protein